MSRSIMPRHHALVPASDLAAISDRAPAWRPGLAGARHSEVFASGREASGAGAALAFAADALRAGETEDRRSLLWVQDRASLKLTGRPYRPGLPATIRHRLVHVACDSCEDALFALEEGLRCRELACVIGEIAGNPRALDFTASRRLSLAAERYGVPLWLVRLDARRDLSSARLRWDVRAAPSARPRWNPAAPGPAAWRAELFRARAHPPGEWLLGAGGGGELILLPVPVRPQEGSKPEVESPSRRTGVARGSLETSLRSAQSLLRTNG